MVGKNNPKRSEGFLGFVSVFSCFRYLACAAAEAQDSGSAIRSTQMPPLLQRHLCKVSGASQTLKTFLYRITHPEIISFPVCPASRYRMLYRIGRGTGRQEVFCAGILYCFLCAGDSRIPGIRLCYKYEGYPPPELQP